MGFRSTFTTEDYNLQWPEWFVDKYKTTIHFTNDFKGTISAKRECKTYHIWAELPDDIQKVLNESRTIDEIILCFLHECEGVTRVHISKDKIRYSEPTGWKEVDEVTHHYCYGCSEI